ncbi:anhydro-N-acetylmuramic acid kinase [Methyloversatilis sp.]|uniref:anhydro-N-acetylmuramic acid kinase n=1 Tax=Methyloversatilis sp. TaxID=2569862 RepID=UPI0027348E50|nr:anhydro-N-acetylmuramic acid kinase [Methyloversatilis sp.]MDP2870464.1 anhydro-N-acetylmuramic acid kinase [Methyloversatilis sp.]MDP3457083.1 anhydro-N-acetylmuramic acid kinase [Methyloversatilis sp.]MDP3579531.1 anhydro-N-acetylmuramic acid kinase [Methyloversatilis sp.]
MRELFIGIMSGTSLDGIDAVLVDFSAERPAQLAHAHRPYAITLRDELTALCASGLDEIRRSQCAAIELAHISADLVSQLLATAGLSAAGVSAIGCHGQTVRHMPAEGYTLQINAPSLLAELSGIAVVADFRTRDLAAGGQGAPLVPAFHAHLFSDATRSRVVLNIGGMSNVTLLAPGEPVRGFDCGPGNVLMDGWIARARGLPYDSDGAWAASGKVDRKLLDGLLSHPFFARQPPKSCGREQFNLDWLDSLLTGSERAEDVQATLAELTAISVCQALASAGFSADEIAVCGGGALNTHLVNRLQAHARAQVISTAHWGVAPGSVESLAFAWLARRTLRGEPGNVPNVTGARGPRILGAVWPA